MTIAEQSNLILAALQAWVRNNKGRAFIAGDPLDVLDELRSKPGTPTAAVLWMDETPWGELDQLGKVYRGFKIVVSRGRGLKMISGESLTEGVAGGDPMFDLIEQAREIARCLRPEDQEGDMILPVYKGTGPFEVSGYILDAMEIRFQLFADIPPQTSEAPANKEETT